MDNLFDATEIRPTIINLLILALMILIIVPTLKVTFGKSFGKFYVRGFSELVDVL